MQVCRYKFIGVVAMTLDDDVRWAQSKDPRHSAAAKFGAILFGKIFVVSSTES
jgi:hypothetical protein